MEGNGAVGKQDEKRKEKRNEKRKEEGKENGKENSGRDVLAFYQAPARTVLRASPSIGN